MIDNAVGCFERWGVIKALIDFKPSKLLMKTKLLALGAKPLCKLALCQLFIYTTVWYIWQF